MLRNRKIIFSLIIGILFSGVAIYASFRNIPVSELLEYMKSINVFWITVSVLIGLSSYFIRALRWQVILTPVKKVGFWHAYHPLTIAFMINCILPGRLGELARPAILYKRDNVEFSKVLATVGTERIFDLITMLFLFIVFISGIELDPGLGIDFNGHMINQDTLHGLWSKMIAISIILISAILMFMMPFTRRTLSRFFSWLPHLLFFTTKHFRDTISNRIHQKSHAILENLSLGFEILKSPAKVLICLALSCAVWLLSFAAFYVMSLGCSGIELSFSQASTVVIIICFFIMLPSVPGFWGIWEVGGIYGLMLFSIPKVEAAGLTLTFHFFQIIPLIVLGLLSSWVTGISIAQAAYRGESDQDTQ